MSVAANVVTVATPVRTEMLAVSPAPPEVIRGT